MKVPVEVSKTKLALYVGLIVAATFSRLIPHIPNVAPIAALALLSGVTLKRPWSFIVPLAAMLVSDVLIGFDEFRITLSVYGSFILTVLIGEWLKRQKNPLQLVSSSLIGSTLFFLITNAAVWQFSRMYPPTLDGLWLSYSYGLPFFRNTLVGDLLWTAALFLAAAYVPVVARAFYSKFSLVHHEPETQLLDL